METEKMSFEEGLQSLKNQVAMLEKGNLPLDEALKVFRDAVDVGRFCNKKLEMAETEVQKIVEDADGFTLEVGKLRCQSCSHHATVTRQQIEPAEGVAIADCPLEQ